MRIRGFYILALLLALCLSACVTKSNAQRKVAEAFKAGETQATKRLQTQQPVVTVVGQVRNHIIPWQEGLTLAQAVDAAAYTGFTDPLNIRLIRGEESVEIKVKDLLRGTKNPVLESEDIIENRR